MAISSKQALGKWLIPKLPISEFGFKILRLELNAMRVRACYLFFPWRWRTKALLRKRREVYANIASGGWLLPGFDHLDLFPGAREVIPWDCRQSLPYADGACAGIRIEHFLEHLDPQKEVTALLSDCFRALRTGGVLRIVVPDAEKFLKAYCSQENASFKPLDMFPFPADLPTRMDIVNHIFHQWHEHR